MKKYEIWVEATKRETGEIGYVEAWETHTFDTLEEAKEFFKTKAQERGEEAYYHLVRMEKKKEYYTVSLVELEVEIDEDGDEGIIDTQFLDSFTVGEDDTTFAGR